MYPDLQQQWPRLKYHRHFMLAEYLNEIYELPGPPQELIDAEPRAADQWARLRRRYELVRQSMRDHLEHVNDKFVQIRRIEHLIPTHLDYQQDPIPLNDPRRYIVLLDQPLDAPAGPPEPHSCADRDRLRHREFSDRPGHLHDDRVQWRSQRAAATPEDSR